MYIYLNVIYNFSILLSICYYFPRISSDKFFKDYRVIDEEVNSTSSDRQLGIFYDSGTNIFCVRQFFSVLEKCFLYSGK